LTLWLSSPFSVLKQRSRLGYRFRVETDFEADVDARDLRDLDGQTLADVLLETLHRYR